MTSIRRGDTEIVIPRITFSQVEPLPFSASPQNDLSTKGGSLSQRQQHQNRRRSSGTSKHSALEKRSKERSADCCGLSLSLCDCCCVPREAPWDESDKSCGDSNASSPFPSARTLKYMHPLGSAVEPEGEDSTTLSAALRLADYSVLQDSLADGSVRLVKAQWIVDRWRDGRTESVRTLAELLRKNEWKGGLLHRRDCLPEEAFVDPQTPLQKVKIVAVSAPWLSHDHPDPEGFHLTRVAVSLDALSRICGSVGETAVFWDFISLRLPPPMSAGWAGEGGPLGGEGENGNGDLNSLIETPRVREDELLDEASKSWDLWFAHENSTVLMLTEVPETAEIAVPWYERAQTFLEACCCGAPKSDKSVKRIPHGPLWDLQILGAFLGSAVQSELERAHSNSGDTEGGGEEEPPFPSRATMSPVDFIRMCRSKIDVGPFRSRAARARMFRVYRQFAWRAIGAYSRALFARSCQFDDHDARLFARFVAFAAETEPPVFRPVRFSFSSTAMGDGGLVALAESIFPVSEEHAEGGTGGWELLDLEYSKVSDTGFRALMAAIGDGRSLKRVLLSRTQIGDHGAIALADALRGERVASRFFSDSAVAHSSVSFSQSAAMALEREVSEAHAGSNVNPNQNPVRLLSLLTSGRSSVAVSPTGALLSHRQRHANRALALEELALYSTAVGDAGAEALAASLSEAKRLKSLLFAFTPVSDRGFQSLLQAMLKGGSPVLTVVDFSYCSRVSSPSAPMAERFLQEISEMQQAEGGGEGPALLLRGSDLKVDMPVLGEGNGRGGGAGANRMKRRGEAGWWGCVCVCLR
uniref:Uncharacterized protein n=1 Tax=Chromera velia CCMP2878 TaxID=1169474 RepID=A0A0G4HJL2_9ALVE|eukprot:Cvel_28293.t1-p1 / transcript=Cvel_28293.t1 / gene=Cvel_28293 / organism=Chromera_velia_CCMP2878 / gene_product=hypothetical protein / transcript_product=hypothetical protein / location=Cvel_scaffold3670:6018-9453(+) / protein_length=810 / sequence_SO=supercontig / SO=protein_coding / is_pseudo=false